MYVNFKNMLKLKKILIYTLYIYIGQLVNIDYPSETKKLLSYEYLQDNGCEYAIQ